MSARVLAGPRARIRRSARTGDWKHECSLTRYGWLPRFVTWNTRFSDLMLLVTVFWVVVVVVCVCVGGGVRGGWGGG